MGFRAKPPLLRDSETYFSQIAFPQGLHLSATASRSSPNTQHELDSERKAAREELIADTKRSAKNGQIGACKIQAKDLARARKSVP